MIPSNRADCEFGSWSTDVPTETIEQPSGGCSKQYFVDPCLFLGKQARKVKQWQKNGFMTKLRENDRLVKLAIYDLNQLF